MITMIGKESVVSFFISLKQHSTALFSVIASPYSTQWRSFRNDIEFLAISLNSYAEFLDYSTEEQQKRQMLEHPVRQVDTFSFFGA